MPINPKAAEHLAVDIRSTKQDLGAIEEQIADLEARREALCLRLNALRGIIGNSDAEQSDSATASADADTPTDDGGEGKTGFREAIRTVLRASTKGMRGRDVNIELQRRNVPYHGKVDQATRVANELYRMAKAGHVKKRGKLYYAPDMTAGG